MNDNITPISLLNVMLAPTETWDDNGEAFAAVYYDGRSDFLISSDKKAIAISLEFCNERCLADEHSGVRRRISAVMSDATLNRPLGKTSALVSMRRDQLLRKTELHIRFDPSLIVTDHIYKVTLRDDTSRKFLGEKTFRFFNRRCCGWAQDELFEVTKAGLWDEDCYFAMRSIPADLSRILKIRFNFNLRVDMPMEKFPELEIRTFLPDETEEYRFVKIKQDEAGTYAEIPFSPTPGKRGVTYVEISCLGESFGGIVFNTAGELVYGSWVGEDVLPLEEYRYYEAVEYLNRSICHPNPDSCVEADVDGEENEEPVSDDFDSEDEFERKIDAFIASEMQKKELEEAAAESDADSVTEVLPEAEPQPSLTEMMSGLVGLTKVKERLTTYEKLVQFNKKRQDCGLPTLSTPLHAMFLGSPGTGKTTVAKMIGRMLASAGVLSKGHVVVRERATLLGQYYNSEATKTQEAIEEAQGGILLIDEAYQLYQPNDSKDPGKFVIESLLTALSDENNRDWMLILAGYTDEMMQMFQMNPGLKSRIPNSNIYTFDDLSEAELMEIAEKYISSNGYEMTDDAHCALWQRLKSDCTHRDKNFGNARHVINIIQTDIIPSMAVRVMASEDESPRNLSLIEAADIPSNPHIIKVNRPRVGYC